MKVLPNLIGMLSMPPLEWVTSFEVFRSELEVFLLCCFQGSHARRIGQSQLNLAGGHSSFADSAFEWLEKEILERQFIVININDIPEILSVCFLPQLPSSLIAGRDTLELGEWKNNIFEGIFKMTICIEGTLIILAMGHWQGGSWRSGVH